MSLHKSLTPDPLRSLSNPNALGQTVLHDMDYYDVVVIGMMESCFNLKTERMDSVDVEDLRKDLCAEFSAIPTSFAQHSVLVVKEHLQVYLRIRPFTQTEIVSGESQECVEIKPPDTVLLRPPQVSQPARLSDKSVTHTAQQFQFSQVYGPETTQREIFDGTVKGLVRDVLEGGNSLVFTYGVTNAGKTYTFLGPDADCGILPRSLNVIFKNIEDRIYTSMNIKPHRCREFTRLTKEQQEEEATLKRNLMRLLKESDGQKIMTSSMSSSSRTLLLDGSSISEPSTMEVSVDNDSFSLDVDCHTKFSVWVSFCEIYNENIHDLLEPISNGSIRRTTLRLSQDVKGNSFVKDLKWIQVNDADEAYKVLKLGKRNQSFSCTKLNSLSSRSHSIFSIRILRIEDFGTPRVHTISELSLCDLAGSERCAKTHNKGERLKEAGNINTSLLILGKCINALRHNQQSKLQQHVPFRESKLTHYLQSFFTGRGKACMIVNINQCPSMFDETLNVLKFSAVAKNVVVLKTKPLPVVPKKSAREVSFIINSADNKKLWGRRKSSLVGWEMSLEDVKEDEIDDPFTDEEDEESCMESMMEETVQEAEDNEADTESYNNLLILAEELKQKLSEEQAEKLALESRIREDVTKEFMELFSKMESDYNDRLMKEKDIIEERAERRLEIFRALVTNNAGEEALAAYADQPKDKMLILNGVIDSIKSDLAGIKKDAEAAQTCLVGLPDSNNVVVLEKQLTELSEELEKTKEHLALKTKEAEIMYDEMQQSKSQLEETKRTLESQAQKFQELMEICHEKDDMIAKLQTTMEQQGEITATDKCFIESIKNEILQLKKNCKCINKDGETDSKENRKRLADAQQLVQEQPPFKKVYEDSRAEKCDLHKHMTDSGSTQLEKQKEELQQQLEVTKADFEKTLKVKEDRIEELKQDQVSLEANVRRLNKELTEMAQVHESALSSLDIEMKKYEKVVAENKSLTNELSLLKQDSMNMREKIKAMEGELSMQKDEQDNILQQLEAAKTLLIGHSESSHQSSQQIKLLTEETEHLKEEQRSKPRDDSFHSAMGALHQECEKIVKDSVQRKDHIEDLQQEVSNLQEALARQQVLSTQLERELSNFRENAQTELKRFEVECNAHVDIQKRCTELESEATNLKLLVENLQEKLHVSTTAASQVTELESQLVVKETQFAALQEKLAESHKRLEEMEPLVATEARRKEGDRRREILKVAEEAIAQKDAELERRAQELLRLKEEATNSTARVKNLSLDLQRKDDDVTDLKEKIADSKKQIQQVQKEIALMREEEKLLKRKLSDSEKSRSQLQASLSSKDQYIHKLKNEQSSAAKSDENLQRYQKACSDLQAKEQIIEDMRLALTEQEETQAEQDRFLEAKLSEIESLTNELSKVKERLTRESMNESKVCRFFEDCRSSQCKRAKQEVGKAEEKLKVSNEKHQADKKKWLEEKLLLINQAKEAEEKRNQEMRKFVDDRERCAKVQVEMEAVSRQLAERDQQLAQWRKERDTLVSALEIQMQKLLASNAEKDQKIKELAGKPQIPPPENTYEKAEELQDILSQKESEIRNVKNAKQNSSNQRNLLAQVEKSVCVKKTEEIQFKKPLPETKTLERDLCSSRTSEEKEPSVLDSSEVSSEGRRTSRFPKPELEIQFTPLRPNKMNVKRQGEGSSVTVKLNRTSRKRKSSEMEKSRCWKTNAKFKATFDRIKQDSVQTENRKNCLRTASRAPVNSEQSPGTPTSTEPLNVKVKKDGTLQKIGEFLQSSPNLLGSKAKKIMSLVKSPEPEGGATLAFKPKKSKRKLYKTEISSPLDIPSHPIIGLEQNDKESDHLIIKRRLRSRTAKK